MCRGGGGRGEGWGREVCGGRGEGGGGGEQYGFRLICLHTYNSSLESATELKFAPFCSS